MSPPEVLGVSVQAIPEDIRGNLDLYALAGQSNMSGRGIVPGSQTTGTVYNFGNDYNWHIGIEPIDSPINQIDKISLDTNAGYGPGMPFGLALGGNIGLIPCAKGSTFISDWQYSHDRNTLYGSMWNRINSALDQGELKGIFFFQGESDASNLSDANQWATRFNALVDSWRDDYGNIPIIFAQIGNHTNDADHPGWSIVKAQQASINRSNVYMITTDDLPINDVHFYTAGYNIIGQRAAAILP